MAIRFPINRETEGVLDGSNAIAEWPLLKFALNDIFGARWISFHYGEGVEIRNSLHAGMVIVTDSTWKNALVWTVY